MTLREGRAAYFAAAGLPADGGYDDDWVHFKVGGIPVAFPNTDGRKEAVPAHDAHHVLTGYETDLVGEAEIGAWEIASGCSGAAFVLNALAAGFTVVWSPRRVYRAYVRGRYSGNLYASGTPDEILERNVGELRTELGLDTVPPDPSAEDRFAFARHGVLMVAMAWGGLVPIAAAIAWWI